MTYDPRYSKLWARDRALGRPRSQDAWPVRVHIDSLVAARMSMRAIAECAGVSTSTVSVIVRRKQATVHRATAAAILRVRPQDAYTRPKGTGMVLNVGARRRVQALLAIGWRHEDIDRAKGHGTRSRTLLTQIGGWITRSTHDAIVRAYDQLSMTPGPSERNRRRALAAGYLPPLAWDDADLDDPNAAPATTTPARSGLDLAEWVWLVNAGEHPERAAERCGVTLKGVEAAISRRAEGYQEAARALSREVAA